jgi:hypothetical protein
MDKQINIIKNAMIDTIKNVKSFRFITACLMVFTLALATTSGIDRLALDVGEKITPWIVPYIFDNDVYAAFYGIILCYLLSGVSSFNSQELYYVIRMGRRRWVVNKSVSIVMTGFIFTLVSFVICMVPFLPKISFMDDWGKVIKTMAFSSNLYSYNLICSPSPTIISSFTPKQAMILTFFMVWLISVMIGLVIFMLNVYINRFASIIMTVCISLIGLSEGLFFLVKWLPYISFFSWYRISTYGNQIFSDWYYPDLSTIVAMAISLIVVSFLMIIVKIKNTELDWASD